MITYFRKVKYGVGLERNFKMEVTKKRHDFRSDSICLPLIFRTSAVENEIVYFQK